MKLLKEKTESLCPVCLETIPARVEAEEDGVFLSHQCPRHGEKRTLLETDTSLYTAIQSRIARNCEPPPYLTIFPTYRCNIGCNVCYVPNRDPAMDMTTEDIEGILQQWPHTDVFFAGGEPTVMENLPELIALTRARGKRAYIVTNGIKLAEPGYLKELVKNGLSGVSLSLNALDGKVLQAVDGEDYLDAKMRAVDNLKRQLRRFAIYFSLVHGVNDGEFGKVFQFTVRQYPFARSFHSECLPGIGRSMNGNRMFLSGMMDMLAQSAGVTRTRLIDLAARGKANLGPYGFSADLRDLRSPIIRTDGWMAATSMAVSRALRSNRPDMRIRVLVGPQTDSVDLEETWSASTTMAISKESPIIVLWEYLIRYHGRTA
jgi:pyruvate-formate lyase-activating enzyme